MEVKGNWSVCGLPRNPSSVLWSRVSGLPRASNATFLFGFHLPAELQLTS